MPCQSFIDVLIRESPHYAREIIRDMRVQDADWLAMVPTGTWPSFTGTSRTKWRLHNVFPNPTHPWTAFETDPDSGCVEGVCCRTRHKICWGHSSENYSLIEQSWATPLLCYENISTADRAVMEWQHIIENILRPATGMLMSNAIRKFGALAMAGTRWAANATMDAFNYTWTADANGDEIYFDCNVAPDNVFKLTPAMLQRRVHPLFHQGYAGKNPFKDMPPLIELKTSDQDLWDLQHAANDPDIKSKWQFEDWGAAQEYWKYNWSGKLGNYAINTEVYQYRFNYVGQFGAVGTPYRYVLVLPAENTSADEGLKWDYNTAYQTACYRISFIHHRGGYRLLTYDAQQINPAMPFLNLDCAGQWKFVNRDIVLDDNGNPFDNSDGLNGRWQSHFKIALEPNNTELCEVIFHKGEPPQVLEIDTCQTCTGYTVQSFACYCPACE